MTVKCFSAHNGHIWALAHSENEWDSLRSRAAGRRISLPCALRLELCRSRDHDSAEANLASSHPVIKRRALLSHITHRVGPFRQIWASLFFTISACCGNYRD